VRFPAPTIGFVMPNSPAAQAKPVTAGAATGLQPGDRVMAIDGDETKTFIDLRVAAAMAKPEAELSVEIDRDGKRLTYLITPRRDEGSGLLSIGVDPARSSALTDVRDSREDVAKMLARIVPDAASLGIGAGSRIESVAGTPVRTYAEIERAARAAGGDSVEVVWSASEQSAESKPQSTRVSLRPDFMTLVTADGAGADASLVGLAPLARVLDFAKGSVNIGTLRPGDVFLRVGSLDGPRISQLMTHLRANPGAVLKATVLREGAETEVTIRTDRDGRVGVYLESAWDLPLLAHSIDEARVSAEEDATSAATAAKALATLPLGSVVTLDGEAVASLADLRAKLVARARGYAGDGPLAFKIGLRDPTPGSTPHDTETMLTARDLKVLRGLGHSFPIPETFFDPEFTVLTANGNPVTAVAMGFRQTVVMVEQVFLTIDRVFRGSVSANQLQGPVGILHTGTKVADEGFMYIVFFMALISVNLAVVNLLPIPIADGGLFVFLMYERIRGKPPSIGFQNAAALAGIALVVGLFLLTFYNDLTRLFGL